VYDYIITGAGPAGCVLAARLSADPSVEVLLLEAGPEDRDPYIHWPAGFYKMTTSTKNGWGYRTVPLAHLNGRRMVFPQGRVLGGGGSINAQVFTRGNAMDYDEWAEAEGCAGWSYEEILPYFRRAEDNERLSNRWHAPAARSACPRCSCVPRRKQACPTTRTSTASGKKAAASTR
jgi:choline dehydrogenase